MKIALTGAEDEENLVLGYLAAYAQKEGYPVEIISC